MVAPQGGQPQPAQRREVRHLPPARTAPAAVENAQPGERPHGAEVFHLVGEEAELRHRAVLVSGPDRAVEAGVAFRQPTDYGLDWLLGRYLRHGPFPALRLGRRRLLADPHDLPAVAGDVDQLLANHLAVLAGLDPVLAGLQADLPGPRAGDDHVAAVHG